MLTSATGATSLLTVPLMIQFGVEPRTAISTNMALLVLMNLGSSAGFHGEDMGDRRRVATLSVITAIASLFGAVLLFYVPTNALRFVVPCAMIAVLAFLLATPRRPEAAPTCKRLDLGYGVIGLLGIYGGFFSGGYVTLVVASCCYFFAYSFLRAIALGRLLNMVSSMAAVGVFAIRGTIDWPLGLGLGVVAFLGAFIGARAARRLPEAWLYRIFSAAVAILAIKSLIDLAK